VAFPTCWLPADSVPHYFMPLYPVVAVLIGVAVERSWLSARKTAWQRAWPRFVICMAAAALGMGAFFGVASSVSDRAPQLAQPPAWAIAYVLAAALAAAVLLRLRDSRQLAHARAMILLVAGFFGLSATGPLMNSRLKAAANTSAEIAALRERLPAGTHLVSFGKLHHRFTYYFHDLVELRDTPQTAADTDPDVEYFCLPLRPRDRAQLPFEWEPIATISCDRSTRADPDNRVVIGRRLPAATVVRETTDRVRR
jgi:hypothetical protein